jgi:hypothetical protein
LIFYSVQRNEIDKVLAEIPSCPLRALEFPSGRATLVILLLDYRQSDLGTYKELGIGFVVAPPDDPLAFGLFPWALPVSHQFSCDAGRNIWGLPKTLHDLQISYGDETVICELRTQPLGAPVLTITLPTTGRLLPPNREVCFNTYSMRDGVAYRATFVRTSEVDEVRTSGQGVELALGDEKVHGTNPIWALLSRLDLAHTAPMFSVWSDRISAQISEPIRLDARRLVDRDQGANLT